MVVKWRFDCKVFSTEVIVSYYLVFFKGHPSNELYLDRDRKKKSNKIELWMNGINLVVRLVILVTSE